MQVHDKLKGLGLNLGVYCALCKVGWVLNRGSMAMEKGYVSMIGVA